MITVETNEKGARKTGRSRYWSVMLVGEHGRVIPFRHFKALTIGVSIVLALSLCALILLGVLYTRQRGQIDALQSNLDQLRTQSTKLRDEKDLYLTQLIALQKQTGSLPEQPAVETRPEAESTPPAAQAKEPPTIEKADLETEEVKKEPPVKKAEPDVQWSADIRNFNVSYDNRQGALTAEFRIYNTSRPKKRLSGRTVVVFKAMGDPPNQWAIVPTVPLQDETPVGKEGRFFRINNYQTESFKTLRRTNSPQYDLATVYIFADKGHQLIGNKELPFNVDYSPPAPVKKAVAAPRPNPEKPVETRDVPAVENTKPGKGAPGDSIAPNNSAPPQGPPAGTVPSPVTPSETSAPASPPGAEQSNPQLDADDARPPEPEGSGTIPKIPATDPKPAQEGDTQ